VKRGAGRTLQIRRFKDTGLREKGEPWTDRGHRQKETSCGPGTPVLLPYICESQVGRTESGPGKGREQRVVTSLAICQADSCISLYDRRCPFEGLQRIRVGWDGLWSEV